MSNPISSLRKSKKSPLFLLDHASPLPISSYDDVDLNNSQNDNLKKSQSLSPFNKDLLSSRDNVANSPLFNHSARNPLPKINQKPSNNSIFSLDKSNIFSNEKEAKSSRVPFKTTIDDSDLLDDVTSSIAINNMKKTFASSSKTNDKSSTAPNDMELMQIMMKKIKTTEAKCALLERDCYQKDKRIKVLESKLELYQKKNYEMENETIKDLEENNIYLQHKIEDMEKFLADYGLVWVGENEKQNNSDLNDLENNSNRSLSNLKNQEFKCDYDLLIKHVKELNSLADENEPKIVEFRNGAKFDTTKSIKLTLYANGICLYDGPFRSFEDGHTKKFCIDIMDGYFPSELQSKYPDGVPFDLIDKRDVYFKDEREKLFQTKGFKGFKLGDEKMSEESNKSNFNHKYVETKLQDKSLTSDQFLSKLPSSIVKNGKMVDIRNDLSNILKGSDTISNKTNETQNVKVIETPILKELRKRNPKITNEQDLLKINDMDNVKLTTIRIKNTRKDETFLIKLKSTDTLQNLKDHIKFNTSYSNFDLASIFPRKNFDNFNLTLEECNLEQNSNILLIPDN